MKLDLNDLTAFVAVARSGGFRDGARTHGTSPSGLSEAVRRLEAQLGVRCIAPRAASCPPRPASACCSGSARP
jgi:DNA-binding transcriptional LysR family regulator